MTKKKKKKIGGEKHFMLELLEKASPLRGGDVPLIYLTQHNMLFQKHSKFLIQNQSWKDFSFLQYHQQFEGI